MALRPPEQVNPVSRARRAGPQVASAILVVPEGPALSEDEQRVLEALELG